MGNLTYEPKLPWEIDTPAKSTGDTVRDLQRDMAYIVAYTAVMVHSSRAELRMLVNTRRGQIVPRGECTFSDGTTVEFADIGAPQIGAPEMAVPDLVARVFETATAMGLELS